ncbi:MAG: Gfo/Idh/MocA family oxidoreductase [Kiritimatiellae bacterium]|nr:Gfo/Idh/MocA family oxidoreductase [Kiritimatiellia bacterium]
MKRVAIVGFGFMGKTHFGAWKKCRGAKVTAICDRDLSQLTAKVEGNIKGAADNSRVPASVKVYDDFDRMLAAGGFDIVDVTLPTALHPRAVIAALGAGCHVLCEKPMALKLADCDRMLAAAKKANRRLMIAHCVRFTPVNVYIRRLVESGEYGSVVAADFSRFIAPPKWSPRGSGWFLDEKRSGGVLFDVHVHDADFIAGLFGRPRGVYTAAHRGRGGFPDHTTTVYSYKNAVVTSDSSFAAAASLVWDATGRVFFEKATVYFGPMYKSPVKVYPNEGRPFVPKLPKKSGYEAEVAYFLDLVEGRVDRPFFTAEDARGSIALLLAERRSSARRK